MHRTLTCSTSFKYNVLILILSFWTCTALAQIPGSIDASFNPFENTPANELRADVIYKVLEQPDGKILVGGSFPLFRGQIANGIVRLNADLSPDVNFVFDNTGNGTVWSIALQSDGKILVGGEFNRYAGSTSKNIVRLMPNGTVDASFNAGTGADAMVTAIAVLGNGQIMVGGQFTSFDGKPAGRMVRLNSNGSVDITLDTSGLFDNSPNVILPQGDKWVVAGNMTSCRGNTIGRIARINADGNCDNTFQAGTGSSGTIHDMKFDQQGRILLAGFINNFNGQNARHLTRLSAEGAVDVPFQTGTVFDFYTRALNIHSDGTITVMGLFKQFNNQLVGHAVNITENGANTNAITGIDGFQFPPFTYTELSNGNIIVASGYSHYLEENVYMIGVYDKSGEIVHRNTHTKGFNGSIQVTKELKDGRIMVGGFFNYYNGEYTGNALARLNPDGTLDTSFRIGAGFNSLVQDIEVQPDGKLILAGFFSEFDGTTSRSIIRLLPNGEIDPSFHIGSGFINAVYDVELLDNGKILAVGSFTMYNGTAANRIVRLNPDGSRDETFLTGAGFNSSVLRAKVLQDGRIVLAGLFTNYQNQPFSRIIRLNADGTIDTSFNPGTGADANINVFASDQEGRIYIGGGFRHFDGVEVNRVARLLPDGSRDASFIVGAGFDSDVYSMNIDRRGRLLVGGLFSKYDDKNAILVARLNIDGSLDSEFMSGLGMDNGSFKGLFDEVTMIYTLESGDFLVGGFFNRIGMHVRSGMAKLQYGLPTSIDDDGIAPTLPTAFALHGNYPNPFNPTTTLRVNMPEAAELSVRVYDLTGRVVMQLPARNLQAGRHNITLDASRLGSGVYLYRLSTGTWAASGKMTLVK